VEHLLGLDFMTKVKCLPQFREMSFMVRAVGMISVPAIYAHPLTFAMRQLIGVRQ
jgi:hypothetical protein